MTNDTSNITPAPDPAAIDAFEADYAAARELRMNLAVICTSDDAPRYRECFALRARFPNIILYTYQRAVCVILGPPTSTVAAAEEARDAMQPAANAKGELLN
jgi:hypothetical protein